MANAFISATELPLGEYAMVEAVGGRTVVSRMVVRRSAKPDTRALLCTGRTH